MKLLTSHLSGLHAHSPRQVWSVLGVGMHIVPILFVYFIGVPVVLLSYHLHTQVVGGAQCFLEREGSVPATR